jgi:hypothetical protein
MPKIVARSMARPLFESLSQRPFAGLIMGRFNRSCNLVEAEQRLIALTSAGIGDGPFSIVLADQPKFFASLPLDQPVYATHQTLQIGDWQLDLTKAVVWEPKIDWPDPPFAPPPALCKNLASYRVWPPDKGRSPLAQGLARSARQAAAALGQALTDQRGLEAAVTQLAGLGQGLTPAGDDYLLGVMAALWLTGQPDLPPQIAHLAAPQTTLLSAAFLQAAARGEFIEPWHALMRAVRGKNDTPIEKALHRIAHFGASSGTDALAGFASVVSPKTSITIYT